MLKFGVVVAAFVIMLTGGCFLTGLPALQPADGEDVGEVLEFRINPENSTDPGGLGAVRFVRGPGNLYEYQVLGDEVVQAPDDEQVTTLIRRAGERNGAPVYLIQIRVSVEPAGDMVLMNYLLSVVAVQKDGAGIQAVFDSQMPGVADLAAEFGVIVEPLAGRYVSLLRAKSVTTKPDVLGFIEAARARGLVGWEEELGISVYEDFLNAL